MPRFTTRLCPGPCQQIKLFRTDQKTCGCGGSAVKQASESDKIKQNERICSLPKTTIHTLEDLIAHFEVDLSVWTVKEFCANKWEMGYVRKAEKVEWTEPVEVVKDETTGAETVTTPARKLSSKEFEADSRPMYQVKAIFKRTVDTVQSDKLVSDNSRLLRTVAKQKVDLDALSKYNRHLAKGHAGYEELLANVDQFVDALGQFDGPKFEMSPKKPLYVSPVADSHSEDAVMLWSDTHFGDVIRHGDTSGFPEYDLPIAGNRWGYVIKKAKQVLSLHRAMYPIDTLYIWFGGDMGNGDLHDAPVSNSLFIAPQVHFTYHMLRLGLEDMLTLTKPDPITGVTVVKRIKLLFTVGNHMRESTSKYMPMKYQAQRTFDWLIYQFIIERFKNEPNVTIKQEMMPYITEDIRGHRHLFAHGMQVGYRNSPDMQARSMDGFLKTIRSLFDSPEFRRKNGLEGSTFARACIGDIHVPVQFPRLISNGSLNGQNELGVNWGLEPIPAGQQLFGVSDKHIQTWNYFIECSHIQREEEDFNSYGIFAADYAKRHGRS